MTQIARAIDVGYGNTKYTYAKNGEIRCGLFPSQSHWNTIDPTRNVLGEKRDTVAVPVAGMFHEVGPGVSAARGRYRATNMHDGYVDTPEYQAFVKGALTYINEERIRVLVMGLPVKHLTTKRAVLERMWTGEHELADGKRVTVDSVRVFAQPQGALAYYSMTTGQESVRKGDLNLVIDPGQRTFDWLVSRGMVLLQGQSSSTDRGMHDILTAIADAITADLGEEYRDLEAIDRAIRTRRPLTLYQKSYPMQKYKPIADKITQEAIARMQEHVRDVPAIQNILLVGGGAQLFKAAVKAAFPKHTITDMQEPVFANLRGFQCLAEELLAQRARRATVPEAGGVSS